MKEAVIDKRVASPELKFGGATDVFKLFSLPNVSFG
jgi:hypothetical protein